MAIVGITEDVDEIENLVFGGDEEDHAERIYKLKREVAEFRGAVLPLAAPLDVAQGSVPLVDQRSPRTSATSMTTRYVLRTPSKGHDRLLTDVLQADLARVGVRQSKIAVRRTRTCAESRHGRPSLLRRP